MLSAVLLSGAAAGAAVVRVLLRLLLLLMGGLRTDLGRAAGGPLTDCWLLLLLLKMLPRCGDAQVLQDHRLRSGGVQVVNPVRHRGGTRRAHAHAGKRRREARCVAMGYAWEAMKLND